MIMGGSTVASMASIAPATPPILYPVRIAAFTAIAPVSYQIVLPTEIRTKNCRCSCDEAFLYPIKADEATNLYIKECVPEFVSLPIHEGDAVGELQIYLKNQLLFSQKIVSIETVEKNFWDILREITQRNGFKICGSINIWRNVG